MKKEKKEKTHNPTYNCDLCANKNRRANIKRQREINEIPETDDFSTSMSPSPVIKFVRVVINNFPIPGLRGSTSWFIIPPGSGNLLDGSYSQRRIHVIRNVGKTTSNEGERVVLRHAWLPSGFQFCFYIYERTRYIRQTCYKNLGDYNDAFSEIEKESTSY